MDCLWILLGDKNFTKSKYGKEKSHKYKANWYFDPIEINLVALLINLPTSLKILFQKK